jgi:hypothetical protein
MKDRIFYKGLLCEYIDLFGGPPEVGVIITHYFSDDWKEELFLIVGKAGLEYIPHRSVINIYSKQ